MVPPAEISEWHQATLASFETLEAAISVFPEDDEIDFLTQFAISTALELEEAKIQAAEESMPEGVRQQLVEDGCVDDPDATPTAAPTETPTESSDDHGNDINSATAVAVGEAVEGYLGNRDRNDGLVWDDKDAFVVQAEGGRRYLVKLSPISISYDTRDPGQDPRIAVYDSAGQEIARHGEDSAIGELDWQAESAGSYYIVLGDGGSTGSYTLTIFEDDHANTLADATPVAVGVSAEGVVNYENDTDLFVFEAEAGETYKIDVSLGSLSDSWLTLSDFQDDVLAYGTSLDDAVESIAWWKSPSSGSYYVTIGGSSGDTGSYTLTISLSDIIDDHGNDFDSATAVTVGESKEGAVDYSGDNDWFVFDTEGGEVYEIIISLGSLTDSWVGLWDSQQFGLAYNDDYDGTPASRIVVDAPRSGGSYYVVTGGTGGTGSYTLTISLSSLPDDHGSHFDTATSVMVGDSVEGVVDFDGDFDWFVFEAVEGKNYVIDVALGSLSDSEVFLVGSDKEVLAYNDDFGDTLASRITWEAPSSGIFYVITAGDGTGSYTLTISGEADGRGDSAMTQLTDNNFELDASPSWSSDGSRIAFISDRDGDNEIYVMNIDGSGVIQLTDDFASDEDPEWSPDGSRIAFHSDRDGDYEIYVMNADGSGVTQLTDNSDADRGSAWSPDGTRIAFHSDSDGDYEIYVMSADGSGVIQLTDNSYADGRAAWSPGGTRVAFQSDRDGDYEIYVMSADGSGVIRLTDNSYADGGPAWSPDGSRIAFQSDRDGDYEIYVMSADGSGVVQLTDNSYADVASAWSPDGSRIAFHSDRDGDYEIYVITVDS